MAQRNITDRAERYRAQNSVTGPRKCVMCGSRSDLQVMHLTGNESHGETANLAYGCRSCNGILSAAFKTLKLGRPTNQYNPAKASVPTFEQYMWAVSNHTRGAHDDGGKVIHATPKSKRIEYARRIVSKAQATKRERADDRWNPAQFTQALKEFSGLRGVDKDPSRQTAIEDLVFAAETESDLFDEGDSHLNKTQILKVRAFIAKWGRKNPASASAEVFEEFHGFKPSEVITVTKKHHYHEHLAAAGKLTHLKVDGIDKQPHTIKGFKGAILAFNEECNQLFIEGGDQSLDLSAFGLDAPHELETLGRLTDIGYQTNKTHLGDEGGEAVYVHKFRSTNVGGKHVIVRVARYPDLIYDRRNEQLLLSGGSYEILAEGINK